MVEDAAPTVVLDSADWSEINREFDEKGWTDGLPILVPTETNIRRLLESGGWSGDEAVGELLPSMRTATTGEIAVNAAMAGCLPAEFPVVVAAVRALTDPDMALTTVLTTTHSVSPLVFISGPLTSELGINNGRYEMDFRWARNAAIQRAVNLVSLNIAGIRGVTIKHTFGQMIRYHYCISENEEESPWEPLRVEFGFAPKDTTVTMFATEPPHHYENWGGPTPQLFLSSLCDAVVTAGCRSLEGGENTTVLMLSPEHAIPLHAGGFSKADVKRFVYEHARIPLDRIPMNHTQVFSAEWKKFYTGGMPGMRVPMSLSPADISVVVAGGPGPNSLIIPCVTGPKPITRRVEVADGTPVRAR